MDNPFNEEGDFKIIATCETKEPAKTKKKKDAGRKITDNKLTSDADEESVIMPEAF